MKIFVYGNCQGASYEAALRGLVATEDVLIAARDGYDNVRDCDVVLLQSEFIPHASDPRSPLKLTGQTVITVPTFYFSGFAPDAVIERCSGRTLTCPAGVYNSSIALHGFLTGLSVDETVALFNPETYAALDFESYWDASRQTSIADMDACGLDGERLFEGFRGYGRFALSPHHPVLGVFEDIVRGLMRVHALPPAQGGERRADPMVINGDWPFYPGLAPQLGLPRSLDFAFDPPRPGSIAKSAIPLRDFVRRSFAEYAAWPEGSISSERLRLQADLYAQVLPRTRRSRPRPVHVYSDLPSTSYWKGSVAALPVDAVDPVVQTKWPVGTQDRIATGGSCFAQHIARTLIRSGRQFLECEPAPADLSPSEAARRHFGVFSARYGNIYTTRQLHQLVARATGTFNPVDMVWQRPDGRFVDPFRPQVEPDGFASAAEALADTGRHLKAVRAMLEQADVFIFTLGLTECWASAVDGAVFPIAPGVVAGDMDPQRYRFHNFTASQVRVDLRLALDLMRAINPRLRVILTVSPVPLVATYESRHVLVSTTFSKSALRVAAEEIVSDCDFVDYFPSYEIVAGSHAAGCFFETDKRSVSPAGVDHVMGIFGRHYLDAVVEPTAEPLAGPVQVINPIFAEIAARSRFLCDEEALGDTVGDEALRRDFATA